MDSRLSQLWRVYFWRIRKDGGLARPEDTSTENLIPTEECGEVKNSSVFQEARSYQLVEIVKDGQVVWSRECHELDVRISWPDPEPPTGEHYYYLHVIQADGQQAWSSPVWIRRAC